MKKYLSLITLTLCLCIGSADAAEESVEAAEVEAEYLEVSLDQVDPSGDVLGVNLDTVPMTKGGSCYASLDCGDGNTVSCAGNNTCQTTIAGVKCDGVEVRCPNFCSVGVHCPGGRLRICWSTSGDCQQFPPACNGFPLICRGPF